MRYFYSPYYLTQNVKKSSFGRQNGSRNNVVITSFSGWL